MLHAIINKHRQYLFLFFIFFYTSCLANNNFTDINTNNSNNQGSILLFVSLGMPDNALRSYLLQAKQYHIPVLIRGLYTSKNDTLSDKTIGSFNDTANRIFNLLKNQNGQNSQQNNQNSVAELKKAMGGVSINPLLFRNFNINVVPALVVTNHLSCINSNHQKYNNTHCPASNFDVVYGNIPVKKQLKIIAEKSDNKKRANIALERLNIYKTREFE